MVFSYLFLPGISPAYFCGMYPVELPSDRNILARQDIRPGNEHAGRNHIEKGYDEAGY